MTGWKDFERHVARVLDGRRFWANSGEEWDVESPEALVQCKLRKTCSLEQLTHLVEQAAERAAAVGKVGIVAIKVRRGIGRESEPLWVFSESTLRLWLRSTDLATPRP